MDDGVKLYAAVIKALHEKWEPHETQIEVGQALFDDDCRNLFVQCGRKWGKTEIVIYALYRWAMLYPKSACYYIAPFQKQAREIVWAPRRIQEFIPKEWIKSINETEMRITLHNGSFIKVDGSDNFNAYRGISPHFMVYDEFKDFRREWHEAMEPNLLPNKAPLIFIGTPPDRECQYTEIAKEYQLHPKKKFFQFTSMDNPHNDVEWLQDTKESLYNRGEGDVWEREYMARFVRGGATSIFPMLDDKFHKFDAAVLKEKIRRDRKNFQWYCIADPATASCFGVLFVAVNPYTKEVYCLKEIYERQQSQMTVGRIMAKVIELSNELNHDGRLDILYVADEAATWFRNEVEQGDETAISWTATHKHANPKEAGLSILKDALLQKKVFISTDCPNLWWEMENYCKDKNGKIPKVDDHLIDCFRYFVGANYYRLNAANPRMEDVDDMKRAITLEQDFPEGMGYEDW